MILLTIFVGFVFVGMCFGANPDHEACQPVE